MDPNKTASCLESSVPARLVNNKYYRVWSLTRQGFLALKDGAKNVYFSKTKDENSSKIKARRKFHPQKNGFFLGFQEGSEEDESKYVLQADAEDNVLVKLYSEANGANKDRATFYLEDFGGQSYFKALKILEPDGKCLASNEAKGLSLKKYDPSYPHPDTVFVITED